MWPEPSPKYLARVRREDEEVLQLSRRPPEEAATYLTWEACGQQVLPALTEVEKARVLNDKAGFDEAARAAGVPVPELLAVLPDADARLRPLFQVLARRSPAGAVVKPLTGRKGKGVVAFATIEADGRHGTTVRGHRRAVRAAVRQADAAFEGEPGVVVQELLRQHPAMDDYAPQPLSTVRVVTLLRRDCSVRLLGAFLRLGEAGAMSDNTSRGGTAVDVDVLTGRLGEGVVADPLVRLRQLPGAREPFTGRQLPGWGQVVALCESAAPQFPFARLVGWDVMPTADGPRLIEANWGIRVRTLQAARGAGLLDDELRSDLAELGVELAPAPVTSGTVEGPAGPS